MPWTTPNFRTWLRGEYSITLLGKYFVSAYLGSTIGLHTDLASAKIDCTLHHRNLRSFPMRKVYFGNYTFIVTGRITTLAHSVEEAERKLRAMIAGEQDWGDDKEKPYSFMNGGIETQSGLELELPEEDSFEFVPGSVAEYTDFLPEDHNEYDPEGEDKEEDEEEEESEAEGADFDDSDNQRSAG